MERIKQMKLKNAFFIITLILLLLGILLSVLSFWGCIELRRKIETKGQISFQVNSKAQLDSEYTDYHSRNGHAGLLGVLQIVLPVLFLVLSLLLADVIFYRLKLKAPLSLLQNSAGRIMQNDLDFTIESASQDELGQLCTAFEAMRLELLKNNRELWWQVEERKRLNAAFSHDLRNPVTVLKGAAQILQKGLAKDGQNDENAKNTVALISEYAGRIETYIEAMTGAQKLDDILFTPALTQWDPFVRELCSSLAVLGNSNGFTIEFHFENNAKLLFLDKSIVSNVAENLIANSMRYGESKIQVNLISCKETLTISVADCGPGFPQRILNSGAKPFLRGEDTSEQTKHFGMGLYVSKIMCKKHGGTLSLQNTPYGALVTAVFNILKP